MTTECTPHILLSFWPIWPRADLLCTDLATLPAGAHPLGVPGPQASATAGLRACMRAYARVCMCVRACICAYVCVRVCASARVRRYN